MNSITIRDREVFLNELNDRFVFIDETDLHYFRLFFSYAFKFPEKELDHYLYKKQGYVRRLFSSESWDEWTENRTSLGKVTDLFLDFLTNKTKVSIFVDRLNFETLEAAISEIDLFFQMHNEKFFTQTVIGNFFAYNIYLNFNELKFFDHYYRLPNGGQIYFQARNFEFSFREIPPPPPLVVFPKARQLFPAG